MIERSIPAADAAVRRHIEVRTDIGFGRDHILRIYDEPGPGLELLGHLGCGTPIYGRKSIGPASARPAAGLRLFPA